MRIAMVVAVLLALGVGALSAASVAGPQAVSSEEVSAAALAIPRPSVTHTSPEEAALAAAVRFHGDGEGLEATVVFRFPEPDDYDVRVAVTRASDGSCRMWGAWQVDLDGSRRDGWVASGDGRADLC